MKTRLIIILLTITIVTGFINILNAQPRENFRERFKDQLNLSTEQERKIDELKYEHDKIVLDKRNEIEKNRLEIDHMMQTNSIDEAKLKSLTKRNSEIQADLKQLKVDHWLNVYNILDDSQKQLWTEKFETRHGGPRDRMRNFGQRDERFNKEGMPNCQYNGRFKRNF